MAKNQTTYTLNIKAIADLKEAQNAFKNLEKTMQNSTDFKSNSKTNGLISTFSEAQRKLEKIIQTGQKGFSSSSMAKDALKDMTSLEKSLDDIFITYREMMNNPLDFIESKTLANITKLNSGMKTYEKTTKKIESLRTSRDKLTTGRDVLQERLNSFYSGAKETVTIPVKFNLSDESLMTELTVAKERMDSALKVSGKDSTEYKNAQKSYIQAIESALQGANTEIKQFNTDINKLNKSKFDEIKTSVLAVVDAAKQSGAALDEDLLNQISNAKTGKDWMNIATQIVDGNTKIGQSMKSIAEIEATNTLSKYGTALENLRNKYTALSSTTSIIKENYNALADTERAQKSIQTLTNRIEYFFSLQNGFRIMTRLIRNAFQTVQDLDAAMTETAVVTDNTVGDMWDQLATYTKEANALGATTQGAYETMTLYYQQGLKDQEAWDMGVETMKMARIANMDYTEATDAMTAAVRGFNLELNSTSAQRINDVYSELAAVTASDTQEIATAMSKVASLAHNAGMDLETTAVYLSEAIETTREAPENIGTAMKTILARFTALTKDPSELTTEEQEALGDEEVDANTTEAALKKAGVALRDENGNFRDAKDILLELNEVWDTLDKNTQRYIATQAAGSRQQSRFIAMMQDYSRTQELLGAAQNSTGASQEQFDKTLESLESKLNRLKNAWNEFTMGLANNKVIKWVVDALTDLLTIINKLTGESGKLISAITKWAVALGTFKGAGKILAGISKLMGANVDFEQIGIKGAASLIGGLVSNFKKTGSKQLKSTLSSILNNSIKGIKTNFDLGAFFNTTGIKLNTEDVQLLDAQRLYDPTAIMAYNTALNQLKDTEAALNIARTTNNSLQEAQVLLDQEQIALNTTKIATIAKEETAEAASNIAKLATLKTQGLVNTAEWDGAVASLMNALALDDEAASAFVAAAANGDLAAAFKAAGISAGTATLALGPLIVALGIIAAVVGTIALDKWLGVEGEYKRLSSAAEGWANQLDAVNTELDDLDSAMSTIQDSNLDNLTEGTWEWYQALLKINEEITSLIEKYPELAAYTSVDDSGQLTISDEGYAALETMLVDRAQEAQELTYLSQSAQKSAEAKTLDTTSTGNEIGLAADAGIVELDSETKQSIAALNAEAANLGKLYVQQHGNDTLAQTYSASDFQFDTTKFLAKTTKELRNDFKNVMGYEASEDLTRQELAQMLAANEFKQQTDSNIDVLSPVFEKFKSLDTQKLNEFASNSEALSTWLAENGFNYTDFVNAGGLDALTKLNYINQGIFDQTLYDTASNMRSVAETETGDVYTQRTAALNEVMGLNFTEDEVEQLWEDQVYQGIMNGNAKAKQQLQKDTINQYNDVFDAKNKQVFKANADNIEEAADQINRLLGLEGKAQLKAKFIAENWDLVKEAINGSKTAMSKLTALSEHEEAVAKGIGEKIKKAYLATADIDDPKLLNMDISTAFDYSQVSTLLDQLEEDFANANLNADGTINMDTSSALQQLQTLYNTAIAAAQAGVDGAQEEADRISELMTQVAAENGLVMEEHDDTTTMDVPVYTLGNTSKNGGQGSTSLAMQASNATTTIEIPTKYFTFKKGKKDGGDGDGGKVRTTTPSNTGGSGGGGGGSGSKTKWENPFEKWDNALEKFEKLMRKADKLNTKYELYLKDQSKTPAETHEVLQELLDTYKKAEAQAVKGKNIAQKEVDKRYKGYLVNDDGKVKKVKGKKVKTSKYITYDEESGAYVLNARGKKAVNKGKKLGQYVAATLEQLRENQDAVEDFEDKELEAQEAQTELLESTRDSALSFIDSIFEMMNEKDQKEIDAQQDEIDRLTDIDNSINDSNQRLMDSIQDNINKIRQDRDNKKTEQDLADKRTQLALLKRDTSGANAVKIKQLEKEIADAEEDYTDSLVDQQIDALQGDLDKASEQRQKQIEILEEQLEVQQKQLDEQSGETFNKTLEWITNHIDKTTGELTSDGFKELRQYLLEKNDYNTYNAWKEYADVVANLDSLYSWLRDTTQTGAIAATNFAPDNTEILETYREKLRTVASNSIKDTNKLSKVLTAVDNMSSEDFNNLSYFWDKVAKEADLTDQELSDIKLATDNLGTQFKEALKNTEWMQKLLDLAGVGGLANGTQAISTTDNTTTYSNLNQTAYKNGNGTAVNDTTGKTEVGSYGTNAAGITTFTSQGEAGTIRDKFDAEQIKSGDTVQFRKLDDESDTIYEGTVNTQGNIVYKGTIYDGTKAIWAGDSADEDTYQEAELDGDDTVEASGILSNLPAKRETTEFGTAKRKLIQQGLNKLIKAGLIKNQYNKTYKSKKEGGKGEQTKVLSPTGKIGKQSKTVMKHLQSNIGVTGSAYSGHWNASTANKFRNSQYYGKYKTGGLADYTGPAWLDGTPTKPELVLNAKDTENFIQLKDILSSVMSNSSGYTAASSDTTINLDIKVDQMANDYDAEQLAKQIQKEITKSSNYKNVRTVRRSK